MTDRLRGRAEIRIVGAEIWRFLDRCAAAGIDPDHVKALDELTCIAFIPFKDLTKAEKLADRTGCRITVLRTLGAAGAARKLKRRRALVCTAAALFLLLCASGLFVWDVEVDFNDSAVPDGQILRVLRRQGVGVGSFWPAFRGERIRTGALCQLPELSFLTVNVRAGRATVLAKAAVRPPEIWDRTRSADVTAAAGGVIASVTVLAGEAQVKRGDAVAPGQVLIAGTSSDPRARGEVTAHTFREVTAAAPLTRLEKEPSGRPIRRFALIVGERRINFYPGSGILPPECDKMTKEIPLGIKNSFSLPLKWITEIRQPYVLTPVPADREQLERRLESAVRKQLSDRLGDRGEVIRSFVTFGTDGDKLTATVRAECLERIDLDTPRE